MDENLMITGLMAVFGACFGSFANVVAYRMPMKQSIGGRSHCPKCKKAIPAWANLPVLGWILLRGKGYCCKGRISVRYPLIEVLMAVAFAGCFLVARDVVEAASYAWLCFALYCAGAVDYKDGWIPDSFTLCTIPVGIFSTSWVAYHSQTVGNAAEIAVFAGLESLADAMLAWGALAMLAAVVCRVFRKEESLGGGDLTLIAMVASYFGTAGAAASIGIGAFATLILLAFEKVAEKGKPTRTAYDGPEAETGTPFGPGICIGAAVWLFWLRDVAAGNPLTSIFDQVF